MSTTTDTPTVSASADPTIEQVRELLFGHKQRENEALATAHKEQLRQLEQALTAQVTQLKAELASVEQRIAERQDESITSIGSAIDQLGQSVKGLVKR